MNKYGRPLLGCTIKPKLGLSAKNYGRAVYECLRGGLDFTKDDENVNSQPFMRWRDRFDFVHGGDPQGRSARPASARATTSTCTAPTPEEMYERAEFAKELGAPIIMHDFLTGGFCANTGLANWCRKNGVLLHIHRAMHAVLDRNPHHGIHFRVLAKALRLSGGDHLHSGTVVGKLEGDRAGDAGLDRPHARALRQGRPLAAASSSIRTGARCPACSRLPPAASTSGTCRRWSPSSATTPCCSSAVARSATPGVTQPVPQPTASRWKPASRHATKVARSRRRARTS